MLKEEDKIFKNSGLYYLPITHTDCSQQSDEEGEVVKKLYKKFQQAKFKDENGNTKTISFDCACFQLDPSNSAGLASI